MDSIEAGLQREETTVKNWWRRLRGALGMGLTWTAGWAPIGAVLGTVLWIIHGPPLTLMQVMTLNATTLGVLGFVGGTIFSILLRMGVRESRFDQLTLPRFAAWGCVGGLLLGALAVASGLWGASSIPLIGVTVAGMATLLGGGSAAASLAIARQAKDGELLEDGLDVAGLELTERAQHLRE